ncbi:ABC transporter substrate-binding protein [Demequina pelophila]|uniref:ABC transporter substrate-binding protein n=1 Tax=Demequina pelophila TaxID=1638984 RepID=UPI000782CC23|nr:extracellular solute-binding protein [Demequina pelophila]
MKNHIGRGRRSLAAVAFIGASALALAACSGSSDSEDSSTAAGDGGESMTSSDEFTYTGQTSNTLIAATLESLEAGACAAAADGTPLVTDSIAAEQWDQQLQVLAANDALPAMQMAPGTPSLMTEWIEAGLVVNLSEVLADLGVEGAVLPAAEATLKQLYQSDDLYALPTEYNIEGFWYNKALFEDAGVDVPETWGDFVVVAETLQAADIQPLSASGTEGWPVTRLVGNYIFRSLGADAMQKVADGEASLTDPEYVEGAEAVAALGESGFFGPAPGSIDYDTAMNQFLTGGAAMFYMGSWALGNFNDESQNQIGIDNIGYFPFPEVEGGAGSIDETPANAGVPVMFGAGAYTDDIGEWVACIAQNYGDVALNEAGQVTGFEITDAPAEQSELTTMVQDQIANATGSVLWFEAAFSPAATTVSQTNGGALAGGNLSGQEFMELVQAQNG